VTHSVPSTNRRPSWRLLLALALLVPVAAAFAGWHWGRPWITSDTATGLIAWDAWRNGGPWNSLPDPDPADLAQDRPSWIAWWSPGQYVWPGTFLALGLPLGSALLVSAAVAAWIRTAGLFFLLRHLGASPAAAAVASLAEAANWQLFSSFGMFIGGEVVQAALLPWLSLGCARLVGRVSLWLPAVPPLLFVGAFGKHSLFLGLLGVLAWMWWETNLRSQAPRLRWLATGALLAVCVLVARLAVDRWIVGGGPTPGDPGQVQHGWMIAVGYPLFAPLSAATGLGSLLGRAFALAGIDFNQGWRQSAAILVATGPVWLLCYLGLARRLPAQPMRRFFLAFLTIYLGLFVFLFARGASVSLEDRHFRPASMVLLGVAAAVAIDSANAARWLKRGLLAALAASSCYGLASVAARVANLHRLDRVAPSGLMQPNLTPAAAAELVRRDAAGGPGGQLIVLCDPGIALEVRHSRILVTDALARPLDWFEARRWHGRVPSLLLVLPAAWQDDPRLPAFQLCFPDYAATDWSASVVDGTLFLSARAGPP
jgi:hypothetical protein